MATDVALRDGSTVHVRSAGQQDVDAVTTFLDSLSPQSRWFRFFGCGVDTRRVARRLLETGVGLVATTGFDGEIVAHACYLPDRPGHAEVALAVADDWQDHGIGTLLLAELAELADAAHITELSAIVHPSNHKMLQVLRDAGHPLDVSSEPGEIHVQLPAHRGPRALDELPTDFVNV